LRLESVEIRELARFWADRGDIMPRTAKTTMWGDTGFFIGGSGGERSEDSPIRGFMANTELHAIA
jgi:hypothetical protein